MKKTKKVKPKHKHRWDWDIVCGCGHESARCKTKNCYEEKCNN